MTPPTELISRLSLVPRQDVVNKPEQARAPLSSPGDSRIQPAFADQLRNRSSRAPASSRRGPATEQPGKNTSTGTFAADQGSKVVNEKPASAGVTQPAEKMSVQGKEAANPPAEDVTASNSPLEQGIVPSLVTPLIEQESPLPEWVGLEVDTADGYSPEDVELLSFSALTVEENQALDDPPENARPVDEGGAKPGQAPLELSRHLSQIGLGKGGLTQDSANGDMPSLPDNQRQSTEEALRQVPQVFRQAWQDVSAEGDTLPGSDLPVVIDDVEGVSIDVPPPHELLKDAGIVGAVQLKQETQEVHKAEVATPLPTVEKSVETSHFTEPEPSVDILPPHVTVGDAAPLNTGNRPVIQNGEIEVLAENRSDRMPSAEQKEVAGLVSELRPLGDGWENVRGTNPLPVQEKGATSSEALTLDVGKVDFSKKLAAYVQQAGDTGKTLKIRLNPPELGTLQIEVGRQSGQITARLEVEMASVKTLILEQMHLLRDALQGQGIKLENIEVEINDQLADQEQEQTSGRQRSSEEQDQADREESGTESETSEDRSFVERSGKPRSARVYPAGEMDIQV